MKYKVIIIDDELPIRKSLNKIIKQRFPECIVAAEAENGKDGISKIREHDPDIIITDIFMPQTDGLSMIEAIHPHAKIIVITGFRDFDKARQAINLNVFDMLVKPIDHYKLTDSISRAIKKIKTEKLNSLKILFAAAINDCDIQRINDYDELITKEISKLDNSDIPYVQEYFMEIFPTMQEMRNIITDSYGSRDNNKSFNLMVEKTTDIKDLVDVFHSCAESIIKNIQSKNITNISKHIQLAIQYINENYKKNLSLESISMYIGLSVVHTSRLFKKETGKTVLDYINEIKLAKAKEMLDTGKYKVYEVADELGFNNSHYFSTIFKRYTGVSPREYLKNKHIHIQ